jgi:hypothetical protein
MKNCSSTLETFEIRQLLSRVGNMSGPLCDDDNVTSSHIMAGSRRDPRPSRCGHGWVALTSGDNCDDVALWICSYSLTLCGLFNNYSIMVYTKMQMVRRSWPDQLAAPQRTSRTTGCSSRSSSTS